MAYLMYMAFDNGGRLDRRSYLFEYQGFAFKLVQDNPRKYLDHFMTILPEGTLAHRERAFSVASDFLASLAWQNRVATGLSEGGGRGWSGSFERLLKGGSYPWKVDQGFGGAVLQDADASWKESFHKEWAALEEVHAVALDKGFADLPIEYQRVVDDAVGKMQRLLAQAIPN